MSNMSNKNNKNNQEGPSNMGLYIIVGLFILAFIGIIAQGFINP